MVTFTGRPFKSVRRGLRFCGCSCPFPAAGSAAEGAGCVASSSAGVNSTYILPAAAPFVPVDDATSVIFAFNVICKSEASISASCPTRRPEASAGSTEESTATRWVDTVINTPASASPAASFESSMRSGNPSKKRTSLAGTTVPVADSKRANSAFASISDASALVTADRRPVALVGLPNCSREAMAIFNCASAERMAAPGRVVLEQSPVLLDQVPSLQCHETSLPALAEQLDQNFRWHWPEIRLPHRS